MKKVLLSLITVFMLSCDGGLAPPPDVEPGFGGTIRFERDTWPSRDSLKNLWLFASQVYPLDSNKVFEGIFGNPPTIYLYPSIDRNLALFADSVSYSFFLPPSTYRYIGVIQRFNDDLNIRSFRMVGLYGTQNNPPDPIAVIVHDFEFVNNISFTVNFHKPPPQPF